MLLNNIVRVPREMKAIHVGNLIQSNIMHTVIVQETQQFQYNLPFLSILFIGDMVFQSWCWRMLSWGLVCILTRPGS
jgi:hypothetical protein